MTGRMMRAVRHHEFGGPEVMVVEEIPIPSPSPTQVLIQVEAAGVNFGDAHRRRGGYYPQPTVFPYTIGGEFGGVVVGVGAEVERFREGDRVFALHNGGAYAEYAIAEERALIMSPKALDSVSGIALIVQGMTAEAMFRDGAALKPGESVFVQGAGGGVGIIALQLAKLRGAGTVIAAASNAQKRTLALQHGADVALDTSKPGWSEELMAATGGKGVDLVFEMTGGSVFEQSCKALADFGRILIYGHASHEMPIINLLPYIPKNVTLRTFYIGPYFERPGFSDEVLAELSTLVTEGKLKLHVGGRYRLDQASEMHRQMEARQTSGKLVVIP